MSNPDEHALAKQQTYARLAARRSVLVRRLTVITLTAFFLQQVLTNFTSVLDGFVVDGLSWAYLYAVGLFAMVVVLTAVYTRSMAKAERENAPSEVTR